MASDMPTKLRNLAYDARAFETDNENQPGGFMLEVAEALEKAAATLDRVHNNLALLEPFHGDEPHDHVLCHDAARSANNQTGG